MIIAKNDFYFKLLVTERFWDGANALERFRDLANAKSGKFIIIKTLLFSLFCLLWLPGVYKHPSSVNLSSLLGWVTVQRTAVPERALMVAKSATDNTDSKMEWSESKPAPLWGR